LSAQENEVRPQSPNPEESQPEVEVYPQSSVSKHVVSPHIQDPTPPRDNRSDSLHVQGPTPIRERGRDSSPRKTNTEGPSL